jgi:Na+/H+ antiporter
VLGLRWPALTKPVSSLRYTVVRLGFVMLGLELVVVLGVTVLVCSVVARRYRVAPPVLLLACGLLLGFVPALRGVHLSSEAVLFLFLPALLYWESLTTSLREIRSNLRGIVLMSTGLVVATAGVVAAVAHGFGLAWGPAWVLGAAVAPTDATAVGVLARALPRRYLTLLRAESLVNDGTALVIFSVALTVTVGESSLSALHVSGLFVLAYVGGAAVGLAVAWLAIRVRARLSDPLQENVATILTPFTAYLVAELISASGVLAVVVAGLIMSQAGPRIGRADTRQQTAAFWSLLTFLLNGTLFVLVGMETQAAVRGLTGTAMGRGVAAVVAVSVAVVAVRFAWLFTTAYLIRLIDRRPEQRLRRVSNRARVMSGVAGFRGAVSLAAAIAVPLVVASGQPFPDRDLIVFVTAGVIVVTLVVQGLLLPRVMRWARLPRDTAVEDERRLAQIQSTEDAIAAIPELAAQLGTDANAADRLRDEYQAHLQVLRADPDADADHLLLQQAKDYRALHLALIARKRATVLQLRDDRAIDDTVLRQLQTRLDTEELRLSRREPIE